MKKLSRNEMKKIMGGFARIREVSDDGGGCGLACVKSSGSTISTGTCSTSTMTISGLTSTICVCSVSGGSGC